MKKNNEEKKSKKKYEENFLVLYYQSVSVILFLASHSLMVRQKKLECDLWYTTFPETQLNQKLL